MPFNVPKRLKEYPQMLGKMADMLLAVCTLLSVDSVASGAGVVGDPSRFRLREPCDDVEDVEDVGEGEGEGEREGDAGEEDEGDEEDEGAGEG